MDDETDGWNDASRCPLLYVMLYIYLLCPHSEHQKKVRSNLNSLNTFNKETDSNKVKTSKSWIQCDSPCPCGCRAQQNMEVIEIGRG